MSWVSYHNKEKRKKNSYPTLQLWYIPKVHHLNLIMRKHQGNPTREVFLPNKRPVSSEVSRSQKTETEELPQMGESEGTWDPAVESETEKGGSSRMVQSS